MVRRHSSLIDTSIIYCGECLDQLKKLPAGCVDLIYIDPPFNSNRNYLSPDDLLTLGWRPEQWLLHC